MKNLWEDIKVSFGYIVLHILDIVLFILAIVTAPIICAAIFLKKRGFESWYCNYMDICYYDSSLWNEASGNDIDEE